MIYQIYICKICKYEKSHLSRLEAYQKSKALTWCNDCQKKTLGKYIKTKEIKID